MTPGTRFFLYGIAIAAVEEFISQGVLKESYFSWVFTVIPFAVFLLAARGVRGFLHRRWSGWQEPLLYYLVMGGIGLAVEWLVIGLAPWKDTTSPRWLVAAFHGGMFSFWGTVALAPLILLDERPEIAGLKRRFLGTFAACMIATYVLTLAAKIGGAGPDTLFLAGIGPLVITFLAMNVFYALYFRRCGRLRRTA